MASPRVSVIMPVYNGERFLAEAIESILAQTFADFEFIIVNDGSTDSTGAILERYAALDARICVIVQTPNQGIVAALNNGFEQARGEYIARMDADDISLPERFEKQVRYLERTPHVGVLGTAISHINETGRLIRGGDTYDLHSPGYVRWSNLFSGSLAHPTVMMRRELALQVGGYHQLAHAAEDYDLWTRLSQITMLDNLSESLLQYRRWAGSITVNFNAPMESSSIECVKLGVSEILSRPISTDEAAYLRHITIAVFGKPPKTLMEVQGTAKLLREIFECYTARYVLTKFERRAISRSMALKYLRLAFLAARHSRSYTAYLMKEAFMLNPTAYLHAMTIIARRVRRARS